MSSSGSEDVDRSYGWKVSATVVILILAIPGLIIEPGPISEILALIMLDAIWRDSAIEEALPDGAE